MNARPAHPTPTPLVKINGSLFFPVERFIFTIKNNSCFSFLQIYYWVTAGFFLQYPEKLRKMNHKTFFGLEINVLKVFKLAGGGET